ncbi:S-methyl-5-thioribose-1-phosphate isomerase [Candidatus Woesearchaeota archaeon]|nr:S-methyl-5-thioribose-1-phosphate isomerase [Candidatus Woesearchaeota archaeon]
MLIQGQNYKTVWMEGNIIKLINQPLLPHRFEITEVHNYEEVYLAIKTMVVRGAPAIGATAAYGVAQAVYDFQGPLKALKHHLAKVNKRIASSRPTAQDLFHGIANVTNSTINSKTVKEAKKKAVEAAEEYANNSVEECKKIGEHGSKLIKNNFKILTHCNAGALATVDYGTALAPIRIAHYNSKKIFIYVDETRPRLQGARLTSFELGEENIPHAIIADNAAGYYMRQKEIDICIVGADRIAANGDVANKIGTYEKAVLAKENDIPFYVAAPLSTFDLNCSSGNKIPIEERDQSEVLFSIGWNDNGDFNKVRISPENSKAKNPAFDITPARYITGIITPKGIINANKQGIRKLFCVERL